MRIHSKAKFFALWEAGVLANHTRLWREPEVAYAAGLPRYGFRELRAARTAGAGRWELVSRSNFWERVSHWARVYRVKWIIDDACPNELTTLCGEVCRTHRGLEGSLAELPHCGMRDAMNAGLLVHRSPMQVHSLLARYMDASSREDLDALLELYPDAAVEFSCFTVNVGVFPHRNTLFWEVRDY